MSLYKRLNNELEKHEDFKEKEKKRHNRVVDNIIKESDINQVREIREDINCIQDNISSDIFDFENDFYSILNKFVKGDDKREVVNRSLTIRDGSVYRYRSSNKLSFTFFNEYISEFIDKNPDGLVSSISEELNCLCDIVNEQGVGEHLDKYLYEGNDYYVMFSSSRSKIFIKTAPVDNEYDCREDILKNLKKVKLDVDNDYVNVDNNLRKYLPAEDDIVDGIKSYKEKTLRIKNIKDNKIQDIREECSKEMAYVTIGKL